MKTIESWIDKYVRLKEEYIVKELNEYDGTYDEYTTISGYFEGMERDIFKVRADCYGVDLFAIRQSVEISELPSPEHQIIIQSINKNHNNYPFLWCAKYFEIVEREVTEIWVAK
jgi:hypothetical protein